MNLEFVDDLIKIWKYYAWRSEYENEVPAAVRWNILSSENKIDGVLMQNNLQYHGFLLVIYMQSFVFYILK